MTDEEKAEIKRNLRLALSKALRELRGRQRDRKTQEALAHEVGMDRSYWGDLERGERNVTLFSLWQMAHALGVAPSRLMLAVDRNYHRLAAKQVVPSEVQFAPELKRLRNFMDESPMMYWLGDRHQNNLYANQPLLDYMGLTLEELRGQGWRASMYPEDIEAYDAVSAKYYPRRLPFTTRYRLRRADGEFHCVAQQAVPQFTSRGIFLGYLGSIIVITAPEALPPRLRRKR